MKSVIFHIGQSKTGTTSIQKFFNRNRKLLYKQGMLYPKLSLGGINHGALSVPTLGRIQRSLVSKIGSDFGSAVDVSLKLWREIGYSVRDRQPDILLISSEFFFSTPNIQTIVDLTRRYISPNAEIKFLSYLRLPSDWYASALQQQLKASSVLPPITRGSGAEKVVRFADFGDTQVRLFSRGHLKGGDIVTDICSVLEVDSTDFLPIGGQTNQSLSAEGAILLQEYRRLHHFDSENIFNEDTADFISRIENEERRSKGKYTKLRIRPEIAQFLDRETPGTIEVKRRFGVDLSLDHAVRMIEEGDLLQLKNVEDVAMFDHSLLEEMRKNLQP